MQARVESEAAGQLWTFSSKQLGAAAFSHSITIRRDELPRLKPVVGDIANNFRHALDHLASAAAQTTLGREEADRRRPRIKFPFPDSDGSIDKELKACTWFLGANYSEALEGVWERHRIYEYYFRVVRIISNDSKHWELCIVNPAALAAQILTLDGKTTPVNIPKDYFVEKDSFEWKGGAANGCEILLSLQFNDIQPRPERNPKPPSPDSVFQCTARFVGDMVDAFRQVK